MPASRGTPVKKLIGMAILFVLIPLFLLWYWVFFLGNKPGFDTLIIIACAVLLAAYAYFLYRKRLSSQAAAGSGEDEFAEGEEDEFGEGGSEEGLSEEEGEFGEDDSEEGFEEEDSGEDLEEESDEENTGEPLAKKVAPKGAPKKQV